MIFQKIYFCAVSSLQYRARAQMPKLTHAKVFASVLVLPLSLFLFLASTTVSAVDKKKFNVSAQVQRANISPSSSSDISSYGDDSFDFTQVGIDLEHSNSRDLRISAGYLLSFSNTQEFDKVYQQTEYTTFYISIKNLLKLSREIKPFFGLGYQRSTFSATERYTIINSAKDKPLSDNSNLSSGLFFSISHSLPFFDEKISLHARFGVTGIDTYSLGGTYQFYGW